MVFQTQNRTFYNHLPLALAALCILRLKVSLITQNLPFFVPLRLVAFPFIFPLFLKKPWEDCGMWLLSRSLHCR